MYVGLQSLGSQRVARAIGAEGFVVISYKSKQTRYPGSLSHELARYFPPCLGTRAATHTQLAGASSYPSQPPRDKASSSCISQLEQTKKDWTERKK